MQGPLWDLAAVEWAQELGPGFLALAGLFTLLGREEFYLAAMPLVYWCMHKGAGRDLAWLLIFSSGLNGLTKGLLKLPRPFWAAPAIALDVETSFGAPSGHAMNAASQWGYLAWRARARFFLWPGLALAVVLLNSFSRLYLGVHYLIDLLVGLVLGAMTLALYLALRDSVARAVRDLPLMWHVLLALLSAAAVLALYWAALAVPGPLGEQLGAQSAIAVGEAWQAAGTTAGLLSGVWVGLVLEARSVRFSVRGMPVQRLVRYLGGFAGILLLWAGLKMIFPEDPFAVGLLLRVLRYALVALWAIYAWPALCLRWGLMKREDETGPANYPSFMKRRPART